MLRAKRCRLAAAAVNRRSCEINARRWRAAAGIATGTLTAGACDLSRRADAANGEEVNNVNGVAESQLCDRHRRTRGATLVHVPLAVQPASGRQAGTTGRALRLWCQLFY